MREETAAPDFEAAWPREIVLIAGKDPLAEIGGGHSAYVRVHGRAALRAGITPHIFCASDRSGTVETDFGVVHWVKSLVPLRLRKGMGSPRYLPLAVIHSPQIAAQVTRFLLSRRGPHLIHGFGVWGEAGLRVRKSLRRQGVEAIPILSVYTTNRHESLAKVRGMRSESDGIFGRLGVIAKHLWIRTAVDRCERRALAGAQVVLVNYESVRRLFPAGRRNGAACLKLPYTSESAFLHGGEEKPPPPASLSRLGPADVPLVLAVSRHDPRKGIEVLLHALARLRAGGVPFRACLVGGGTLLEAHRRLAERLGISDRTSIEGFVDDAWPFLRSADVFVLPSLEEGSGSLALIEALQAGLAVVASDCDGIPEDVADGDSALLVSPGDSEALAKALGRVLQEPSLRGALARRARETFAARFTAAAFTEALAGTYASLAATARGRS
jgi:glycosyltransferase involved in cell wall biosynthesis